MLRLLIDENVHGDIVDGLRRRQPAVDLVRVQDVGLGLGVTKDGHPKHPLYLAGNTRVRPFHRVLVAA